MKRIVYAPAALASLQDILEWTIREFGDAQAQKYTDRLANRLRLIADGKPPCPKPCDLLLQGRRDAAGLGYYREGRHYLIMRETDDTLELVEIFHEKMNIDARLRSLVSTDS